MKHVYIVLIFSILCLFTNNVMAKMKQEITISSASKEKIICFSGKLIFVPSIIKRTIDASMNKFQCNMSIDENSNFSFYVDANTNVGFYTYKPYTNEYVTNYKKIGRLPYVHRDGQVLIFDNNLDGKLASSRIKATPGGDEVHFSIYYIGKHILDVSIKKYNIVIFKVI